MAPEDELPRYLDAPEVAAALRLQVETLYRVIARGSAAYTACVTHNRTR
jgi:predicted DNA-binding transcriptional regulator AlpA